MRVQIKSSVLALAIFASAQAWGGDKTVKYDFQTVTDQPRNYVENQFGEIASTIPTDNLGSYTATYTNRQGVVIQFDCGLITPATLSDTTPTKINSRGQISGYCTKGDFNNRTEVSFIHSRDGLMTIVQVPGADGTELFGLNNRGQAVGQYYTPLIFTESGLFRFHGLIYNRGRLFTFDLPAAAGESRVTTPIGIDDQGRIAGVTYTFNPSTNEYLSWTPFLYDNGQVTDLTPPAAKLDYLGSVSIEDINGLGQVIVHSNKGIFLWDDGQFYTIASPAGFVIQSVDSIDDDSRLYGFYRVDPCPPYPQHCPSYRFLATPTPLKGGNR